MEKVVKDFPGRPELQFELGRSYNDQGVLMQQSNRLSESAAAYTRAIEILEDLVSKHHESGKYQQELGRALNNQAVFAFRQGKVSAAEATHRKVLARRTELVQRFPNIPEYQFEKARTLFELATLLQSSPGQSAPPDRPGGGSPEQIKARLKEAETLHGEALKLFQKLTEINPREPDYLFALAESQNNLADLLRATNRGSDAVQLWEEGIALLDALVRQSRNRMVYAEEQAKFRSNLGVTLSSLGKLKEAEVHLQKAIALRDRLARQAAAPGRPGPLAHRINQAASVGELAIVQARGNQLDKSEASFRQAITILQQADKDHPNRPEVWQEELVQQSNLTQLLKALGKDKELEQCNKRIEELNKKMTKR